jgi:hypothetical protein
VVDEDRDVGSAGAAPRGYVVVVNGEAVQKVLDSAGRERR